MSTLNTALGTLLQTFTPDQITTATATLSAAMILATQSADIPAGLPTFTGPQIVALKTFLFTLNLGSPPVTLSSRDLSAAFDTQVASLVTALNASDTTNTLSAMLLILQLLLAMRPDFIGG